MKKSQDVQNVSSFLFANNMCSSELFSSHIKLVGRCFQQFLGTSKVICRIKTGKNLFGLFYESVGFSFMCIYQNLIFNLKMFWLIRQNPRFVPITVYLYSCFSVRNHQNISHLFFLSPRLYISVGALKLIIHRNWFIFFPSSFFLYFSPIPSSFSLMYAFPLLYHHHNHEFIWSQFQFIFVTFSLFLQNLKVLHNLNEIDGCSNIFGTKSLDFYLN